MSTTVALAALTCATLVGCDRKPRFVPADADSIAVRSPDSIAFYVEDAREHWESADGAAAATLSARIVLDDLRLHDSQPLPQRSRNFLDSLGFAAEVVGESAIAAVNFFSRSDPSGGSWPYLYWRDEAGVHLQALEGSGLKLAGLTERRGSDRVPHAALLFTRGTPRGQQPVVFVWRQPAGIGGWKLIQSLGADSLGGVGTAEFVAPGANNVVLMARTYRNTPRFEECATCPHIYHVRRFHWTDDGLATFDEQIEDSPYRSFVQLIQALAVNDRELAATLVTDPSLLEAAIEYGWGESRGMWRMSPGTDERAQEIVFFRGNQEAYRVQFSRQGSGWGIEGFQPTTRSIE
ncbi:MAG TPA: hypothetical protein VEY91_09935 [Candidatus Limnocylindria bacterium]|nr:hypothetical protein [Candidatus Limnocylindria bacterium]